MNNKRIYQNKAFKTLSILLSLMFIIMVFTGCTTREPDYSGNISTEYTPTTATIFTDSFGYNSIKLAENRDIKVLQLTDIHIGNGILCVKKDTKAIEAICALIEETTPDIIIITGDAVYPVSIASGSNDNLTALRVLSKTIEQYRTPWTIAFGNHDAEYLAQYSKSELCNYLESDELKYCLFDRGPTDIEGMGNHIVNVYNSDNSLNTSLVMIDNGEYSGSTQVSGHDEISQAQADWYSNSMTEIISSTGSVVQSFIFYHVPAKEYQMAWDAYKSGSSDAVYYYGGANEAGEKVSGIEKETPLTTAIYSLGSTKGIFAGHYHLNDFSIEYKGIRYTCGKSIDYLAYPGISNKTEQRGGTVLTLRGLGSSMSTSFSINSIKLSDIQ